MRWFTRTAAEQTADDPWGLGPEESWAPAKSAEEQFEGFGDEPQATVADPGDDILSNLGEDAHRKWTELSKLSQQRQDTQRGDRLEDWGLMDAPDDPIVQELKTLEALRSQGDWAGLAEGIEADYNSFVAQSPGVTQQDPQAQAARRRRLLTADITARPPASPDVVDALDRLGGEINKIRHIGRQKNPGTAATSIWRATHTSLTALYRLLNASGAKGDEGDDEGVTQQDPAQEAVSPSDWRPSTTSRSRRRVKTANGEMVKCPGCDEYVLADEMDPTGKCKTCQDQEEMAYAHNRGRRTKVAMKCDKCGDEVDKVDAHGDCVSCQQQAELDEPATARRADGHWKVARVKHDALRENIEFAETCAVCDKMSRKAPGDPEDGGLCPHCGTSGQFVSSSEQLGRMMRGRQKQKEPGAQSVWDWEKKQGPQAGEYKVPSSLRGVGL